MPDTQQTQNSQPAEPALPSTAPTTGNGLAIAALIVGILAFIGAFIPLVNYASGLLAIVGIVLGGIAISRKNRAKKVAIAGLIVSAIALVLSVILAIVYTIGLATAIDDGLGTASAQSENETGGSASTEDAAGDVPATVEETASEVGTRENPAALGTTVEMSTSGAVEYEVTLGASTLDATAAIIAANQFNEAAAEGLQYALVPVTVVYKGTETGTPWIDLTVEFVSAAGTTHAAYDSSAIAPEPTFTSINDLYPDASGSGNVVIAIPTADAALGTWTISTLFGDTYFYAAQ